jgi:small subunit ribosomal protein S6
MASYETTIITKSATTEEQVNALKSKVESVVALHQGTVANYEDWGTRRLHHVIQKESRGRYVYFAYTGNNGTVAELERNLRINENVVRYLSVLVSDAEDLEELKKPSAIKRPRPRDEFSRDDEGGLSRDE